MRRNSRAVLTGLTVLLSPLKGQEDSSRGSDNSSYDEALSPTSPGPLSVRAGHGERDLGNTITTPSTPELQGINPVFLSSNPSQWSVEEVYEFIASLQGTGGGRGVGVRVWGLALQQNQVHIFPRSSHQADV